MKDLGFQIDFSIIISSGAPYYPYETDHFRKLYPLLKVIIQPFFTFKLPSSIFTIPAINCHFLFFSFLDRRVRAISSISGSKNVRAYCFEFP